MYENIILMMFLMVISTVVLALKKPIIPLVVSLVFLLVGIIIFYPDSTLPYYPWILVLYGIYEAIIFIVATLESL